MIFSLSSPPTRASFSSELYFVERGTGPLSCQETQREKKDRAGRGTQKKKGRAAGHRLPVADTRFLKGGRGKVTFPIGKNKKGIGWRPQKNTVALSSQLGSSFSFERRLKNGGESFFSAGGSPHRRVLWFFLSMPLPFCSKKKDCGYKNSSEACGRFECMQVSQKRRSVTGNVFFKYG
jgi:hypothetical protein